MRKRILVPLATLVLLAACGTDEEAPQSSAAADPAPSAQAATVTTTEGALGTFLTDGSGATLYLFTVDEPGVSNCDAACLEAWPPLLTDGAPVAGGAADAALLGTLERTDGTLQVTYAGRPLYFFAADAAPGDVNGQGVNDVWFVVSPAGDRIVMGPDVDGDTGMGGYGGSSGTSSDTTDSGGYGY
jgi:predicted lipoprotein with Yx(FWY)xxD motif